MINDPLAELWKGDRKPDALEDPDMDEEYIPRMSDTDYGKRFTSNLKAKRPQSPKGDLIPQSGATSRIKAKRPHTSKRSDLSIEDFEKQMKAATARLDFEEAARLRDIIRSMK